MEYERGIGAWIRSIKGRSKKKDKRMAFYIVLIFVQCSTFIHSLYIHLGSSCDGSCGYGKAW